MTFASQLNEWKKANTPPSPPHAPEHTKPIEKAFLRCPVTRVDGGVVRWKPVDKLAAKLLSKSDPIFHPPTPPPTYQDHARNKPSTTNIQRQNPGSTKCGTGKARGKKCKHHGSPSPKTGRPTDGSTCGTGPSVQPISGRHHGLDTERPPGSSEIDKRSEDGHDDRVLSPAEASRRLKEILRRANV